MNVKCIKLDRAKTSSAIFNPSDEDIKTFLNQGFKLVKCENNGVCIFEKDGGTIIDISKYWTI